MSENGATPQEGRKHSFETVPDLVPQSLDWPQLAPWLFSGVALSNFLFLSQLALLTFTFYIRNR
jgi:hypothetical protein